MTGASASREDDRCLYALSFNLRIKSGGLFRSQVQATCMPAPGAALNQRPIVSMQSVP